MADVEYRYVEQSKRSAARTVKAGLTIPRWTESRLGIAISLLCPPSTWNAIRLRNDIRVPLYPPPTLSSRGAFLSSSPFALDFSPISRTRYPFELKFSLIASRFTFGCLTFIFNPVRFPPPLFLSVIRRRFAVRRLFFLRRVFYLWRASN